MPWIIAFPRPLLEQLLDQRVGDALTFVVPGGCNLRCPFCLITQRGETKSGETVLSPPMYAKFIRGAAQERHVACVSIQGEEPLLPESLVYTYEILNTAKELGIPSSIVTNGTYLASEASRLNETGVRLVCISIDSDKPEIHDKLRGKEGAFMATQEGLFVAKTILGDGRLLVSSVLLPGHADYLINMPQYLSKYGITRWCIDPYIRIPARGYGGPVINAGVASALNVLAAEADRHGVNAVVCDDMNQMKELRRGSDCLNNVTFKVLGRNVHVFRLLPDGTCVYGKEILRKHFPSAPKWGPVMDVGKFLQTIVP